MPNGAKGEGVAGTPIIVFTPTTPNSSAAGAITNTGGTDGTSGGYPGGSFGRGAPGNGGGGGTDGNSPANDQNTGGAGGGNYGIGGKGGFGWTPGTPPGWDGGGMGGMSVPGGTTRLFLGGGGGAGSSNNATGAPANGAASSGASGGGMVFVRAGTTSGGGTINARGTAGNTSVGNDASGGGGAGGSVLAFVNNSGGPVGLTINIQGGNGGCNTGGGTSTGTCTVPTGGSPHGPGGGGSGGFALLSGTATVNAAAGANGVTATSTTSTQDYGSTSSSGGFQIVSLSASQIPGSGGQGACFPQLTVTKSTSTPFVAAGAPATYTITVANAASKSTATGVSLSDVLPGNPNITFASNTAPVLAGGATRSPVVDPAVGATSPAWGTFSIPGGGSVALTFVANTAVATAPATYQNPATVTYLDPTRTAAQTVTPGGTYLAGGTVGGSNYNPASSTAEDVTVVTAPTLTKSFNPNAVALNATTVLTVTISNPGSTALTGGGLVDNYPAGMVNAAAPGGATTCGGSVTAAPGGTSFTLSGATFGAVTSCTVTVNVKITAIGTYTNTIPAGALTNTQNVKNIAPASATLFTNVLVTKSFAPNAVAPNASSTVSLLLSNPDSTPLTLANPGLTDSFPAGLVAVGGPVTVAGAGCTGYAPTTIAANATSLTLTAGTLPASASCTVSFDVKSATTGIYSNTASGLTTVETGTTGPASNTSNLGVGLVNIAKAFAPANIVSGGTSTLTFTLSNPTGVAQTAGAFTDTLTNMSVSANQNTGGTCAPVTALTAGQTALSFTGLNVPAAGCTITLTVTSATVGAQNNTSGGVITTLLPRGPSSNTATLNVLGKPTIAKAFAPATILPGGSSTLTFTITNPGPVGLTGMLFTDTYGAGLVNATPLAVGGTCTGVTTTATAGGNTFNVNAGSVPANASCTITVAVTAAAVGGYNNTSSGVATTQTGGAGAGSNTATLSVANPPSIAKAFGTTTINQGGTSVVTFTLTNGNTIALTNLNFTDALSNMSVASPATIGGTCVGTTNSPSLVAGRDGTQPHRALARGELELHGDGHRDFERLGHLEQHRERCRPPPRHPPRRRLQHRDLTVLSPPSLTKAFVPSSIQTGATSVMTFTLTNPNPSNALTNATFTDTLVNMSVSGTQAPGGTCTGITPASITNGATSITLASSSIAAGASCTITVVVTSSVMSVAAGHPNTTGTVSATETSINPGAAATGNLIVWAPPTVTKAFAPTSIASGGTSTVTFTITNPNPGGLTNIRITDDLPTNLSNTAAQTFIGAGRGTCTGTIPTSKVAGLVDPITFSSTNLAGGASCTILMDVTSATAAAYTNTVTNILSDQTPTATTGGSDVLTVGKVSDRQDVLVADGADQRHGDAHLHLHQRQRRGAQQPRLHGHVPGGHGGGRHRCGDHHGRLHGRDSEQRHGRRDLVQPHQLRRDREQRDLLDLVPDPHHQRGREGEHRDGHRPGAVRRLDRHGHHHRIRRADHREGLLARDHHGGRHDDAHLHAHQSQRLRHAHRRCLHRHAHQHVGRGRADRGRHVRGHHAVRPRQRRHGALVHRHHDPGGRQLHGHRRGHQHHGGRAAQHRLGRHDHADADGGHQFRRGEPHCRGHQPLQGVQPRDAPGGTPGHAHLHPHQHPGGGVERPRVHRHAASGPRRGEPVQCDDDLRLGHHHRGAGEQRDHARRRHHGLGREPLHRERRRGERDDGHLHQQRDEPGRHVAGRRIQRRGGDRAVLRRLHPHQGVRRDVDRRGRFDDAHLHAGQSRGSARGLGPGLHRHAARGHDRRRGAGRQQHVRRDVGAGGGRWQRHALGRLARRGSGELHGDGERHRRRRSATT